MARLGVKLVSRLGLVAAIACAAPALASSDMTCSYQRSLENWNTHCSNSVALSPGNDTRINLALLGRDIQGKRAGPSHQPERRWWHDLETSYFSFDDFSAAFWGSDWSQYSRYSGSRCQTLSSGEAAFAAALRTMRGVLEEDIRSLLDGRRMLVKTCNSDDGEEAAATSYSSVPPANKRTREFYDYTAAANAFYAGDWDEARAGFEALTKAKDPWVRETALYMKARVDINAAQDDAFGEWGDFTGITGPGRAMALRAGETFDAYVKAYPNGRYVKSADGLQRRVYWFTGNRDGLKTAYISGLKDTDADDGDFGHLMSEIDQKLLFGTKSGSELAYPELVAVWDLQNMRGWPQPDMDELFDSVLSAEDLAAQKPIFKGREDLYSFLQATHAYYITRDYKRVMELIPDNARRDRYDALQFSRQVLRGMALAQRKDRNEAGFWLDLLKGAEPVYQRPLVELGLALNYERNGKMDAVFAKDSPISDPGIRLILLRSSAGPDILRATVNDKDRSMLEQRTALRALLWKDLSRARYADFLKDKALLEKFPADEESERYDYERESASLDEFRTGEWSQDYVCPDINVTVRKLADNRDDAKGLLCLGEFYRLNGFTYYFNRDRYFPRMPGLGDGPDQFPGTLISRQALYQQVIANPRAAADDRAYALYRAVWCYGPTGNNDCGGEDVAKSQRQAWFHELKTRYAGSKWADKLDYYW